MKGNALSSIIDNSALTQLLHEPISVLDPEPSPGDWIRIMRKYLRMTQTELAKKAKITQPHLVDIEKGKIDPQWGTLRRIFEAMSCNLGIRPEPNKPLEGVLRGRARSVALKRLKQTMGTMALEGQAPEKEMFQKLLESRTDEILSDKSERLRVDENE